MHRHLGSPPPAARDAVIEQARTEERERCEKVAERHLEHPGQWVGHRILKEIRALSQPVPDDGWRTMESAPTDGTDILLCSQILHEAPGGPFFEYIVGAWDVEEVGGDGGWATENGLQPIENRPSYWRPLSPPRPLS
jgi:hypothetical protein